MSCGVALLRVHRIKTNYADLLLQRSHQLQGNPSRLRIIRDSAQFGTMDLSTELTPDGMVTLAVGIRSSYDRSFPLGFCAGNRVFCCDNLAFRAELMVRRKHTLNGIARFSADIAGAVMQLGSFREAEAARIAAMAQEDMSAERADSLILRAAVERGIIPLRSIPHVVREWREPRHEVFQPRTAWSLFNAFTASFSTLQSTNPAELARRTMRLSALIAPAATRETPALAI